MRRANYLLATLGSTLLFLTTDPIPSSTTQAQVAAHDEKVQDEIILARQGLMEAVSGLMNEGEMPENDAEAAVMHANAEAVALSLPALKFLFPAETNPQNPNYAASYRTYALPGIWQKFETFSQHLDATVEAAWALDRSRDRAQFSALARRVLETCEACHAEFRAAFESPFGAR